VIDERFSQRRAEVRAGRRRARLRRTLLVSLLVTLAGVFVGLEQGGHIRLETITVEGLDRLEQDAILMLADIAPDASTLRVRARRIERDITALPLVRSAEVERVGVRAVRIVVEERRPVLIAQHLQTSVLLDRDGIVVAEGSVQGLPVVRLTTRPPEVGETFATHAALSNAYRAWVGLSGPLRARVVEVRAPDRDRLEFELDSGLRILFGRAERIEEKVRAIGAVLADIQDADIRRIDVRVPTFVTVD
jgi:cell division septal protein FtsQ